MSLYLKSIPSLTYFIRIKDTPAKMKEAFLLAAEQFLECEQPHKAVICLQNSREKELVAHLYEKMNQVVYTRLYLDLLQKSFKDLSTEISV